MTGEIDGVQFKFWGEIKGNEIKFDWVTSRGITGVGKWLFTPGSSKVVGTWVSSGRHYYGKWNLKNIA